MYLTLFFLSCNFVDPTPRIRLFYDTVPLCAAFFGSIDWKKISFDFTILYFRVSLKNYIKVIAAIIPAMPPLPNHLSGGTNFCTWKICEFITTHSNASFIETIEHKFPKALTNNFTDTLLQKFELKSNQVISITMCKPLLIGSSFLAFKNMQAHILHVMSAKKNSWDFPSSGSPTVVSFRTFLVW